MNRARKILKSSESKKQPIGYLRAQHLPVPRVENPVRPKSSDTVAHVWAYRLKSPRRSPKRLWATANLHDRIRLGHNKINARRPVDIVRVLWYTHRVGVREVTLHAHAWESILPLAYHSIDLGATKVIHHKGDLRCQRGKPGHLREEWCAHQALKG